jgi:FkbM family methyltransferase
MFCSQQGEDIFLIKNYFNKKISDGIYIELGAVDGKTYSNTYYLQNILGYKGILIEAQPLMFNYLKKIRPNNILINKAISNSKVPVEFIGNTPCGGILQHMSKSFKNSWHKGSKSYFVETEKLDTLCKKYNIKYVDFLSLDVEGGELDVLETINFSNVEYYVICIELDEHNKEKNEKCREILIKNNFTFHKKLFINEFWVNENYSRKNLLFDSDTKISFSGIKNDRTSNIGFHPYAEKHLITKINEELVNKNN